MISFEITHDLNRGKLMFSGRVVRTDAPLRKDGEGHARSWSKRGEASWRIVNCLSGAFARGIEVWELT